MSEQLTLCTTLAFAMDLLILIYKFLIHQKTPQQVVIQQVPDVQQLKAVNKSIFKQLEFILNRTTLSKKAGEEDAKKSNGSFRKGFTQHRADVFGVIKRRAVNGGGFAISKISQRKKELYDELKKMGIKSFLLNILLFS